MNSIKQFCLIMCIALFGLTEAQEGKMEFSVQNAVTHALEHNKQLQNSRKAIELSEAKLKEARAMGLPQADLSLDFMTYFNYELEFSLAGDGQSQPTIDYSKLDAGDIEVMNSLSQMMGGGSTIEMKNQSSFNLQVSQLIFSGQYWAGLKMAKMGKSMAELNFSLSEQDLKKEVMNTYYNSLMLNRIKNILQGNVSTLKTLLEHTNNMYLMGVAEQTDVELLQMNLSKLENSKKQMERNLEMNNNMFRLILGLEPSAVFTLTDSLETLAAQVENALMLSDSLNLESNIAYQLVSKQEELGKKQVKLQQWSYAPTIAAFYKFTGKLITTGLDMTPPNAAGVSLSLPILTGGERSSKILQKKIELDQVQRQKIILEEQLALQHKQLIFDLNNALENYSLQKTNIAVAQRVYTSYQNKYKHGVASSMELTQANNSLLEAERDYVSAIVTLLNAKLAYDKLQNKI